MKYKNIDENAYYARAYAKLIYSYLSAPEYSYVRSTPAAAKQSIQDSQKTAVCLAAIIAMLS